MTTPNDLPPVGATVTDADGRRYLVDITSLGHPRWVTEWAADHWLGVERDARPILTALWREQQARIAAEQERDRLKADMAEMMLDSVGVESFTATAEGMIGKLRGGPLALIMAEAFMRDLGEAPNYVECQLATKTGQFLTVTIQRHDGKTPHQMREQAEARVVELEAKVAAFEVGTEAGRQMREDAARLAQYAAQEGDHVAPPGTPR